MKSKIQNMKEKNINLSNMNNINGIVVNTGSGNITTGNITTGNITQTIKVPSDVKEEFLELLDKMKKEVHELGNEQAIEAVSIIEEETKKTNWNKRTMNFALDVVNNIAANLAANGLTTLVRYGMSLLSL